MEFLHYFIHYFLLLLFGALIIVGFFSITRGWKELRPDGTYEWRGKIFKGWYKFWFREHDKKLRIYYKDREFFKLMLQINTSPANMFNVDYNFPSSIIMDGKPNKKWLLEIEERASIRVEVNENGANSILFFYREEPDYVYPWWVRDMMAGCITCHSSWLGSICFWLPFLLSNRMPPDFLFGFTGHVALSLFLTWIAYCVSLAFVTTALWKKYM